MGPRRVELFSNYPCCVSDPTPFGNQGELLASSLMLHFADVIVFHATRVVTYSIMTYRLATLLHRPYTRLFCRSLRTTLSQPPFITGGDGPRFLLRFPFPITFPV